MQAMLLYDKFTILEFCKFSDFPFLPFYHLSRSFLHQLHPSRHFTSPAILFLTLPSLLSLPFIHPSKLFFVLPHHLLSSSFPSSFIPSFLSSRTFLPLNLHLSFYPSFFCPSIHPVILLSLSALFFIV